MGSFCFINFTPANTGCGCKGDLQPSNCGFYAKMAQMAEFERDLEACEDSQLILLTVREKNSPKDSDPDSGMWIVHSVYGLIDLGESNMEIGVEIAFEELEEALSNSLDPNFTETEIFSDEPPPPRNQLGIKLYPEDAIEIIH